jgi:hypothetical protein
MRAPIGVLIASRWPLSAVPLRPADAGADSASPVYLIKARLFWPGRAKGPAPFKALLALPPAWRAELSLLIGDFNCGIPLFDSQTRTFPCTAWFQRQPGQRLPLRPRPGLTPLDARIRSVRYAQELRVAGFSDHAGLVVELG